MQHTTSEWEKWIHEQTPSKEVAQLFIEKINCLLSNKVQRIRGVIEGKRKETWATYTPEGAYNQALDDLLNNEELKI